MPTVLYEHGDTFAIKVKVLRSFIKPHTDDQVSVNVEVEASEGATPVTFTCDQEVLKPVGTVTPISAEQIAAYEKADKEAQEAEKKNAANDKPARQPVLLPSWRDNLNSLSRSK